jgi:predicted ATPase/class 3 adenylate cyclase
MKVHKVAGLERSARVPELPTGTVTLLFTDIEGSTRLLQQLGSRYTEVLADQRRILRAAFAAHSGHEVDTEGDAFFVAFPRAAAALACAFEAQRALAAHPWPDGAAVRVRMGLHTGEPRLAGGNYVGLDVHRAARIGAAGHGGQVLLSQTTHDLVESELPDGIGLRDLGEHQLKDMRRPERIYQAVLPGLPADFPPLRTLDHHAHNLPEQPTPLLGRQREVAAVRALLLREDVRLVTLTGPGGIGKTRLGLQVAADLTERLSDGVFLVTLASITDPGLVAPTIAQTLGLREAGGRSASESLQAYLATKQLLLVLDNFEQVVAASPVVADLLAACPRLKVLVTSRQALRVRGEHEFPVPPLDLPEGPGNVATLSQSAAAVLFIERALAVKPDFTLTDDAARAVAEICRRLDGLPLAIELAAARVKLLPPDAMLARLSSRLDLLTAGARDLPDRQRTLRDAIGWSYDLLAPDEQALFRRLAVFAGGWTLAAAEVIAAATGTPDLALFDGLGSLVDKSLVRQREVGARREPRFSMLETIREYGLEQLGASGEDETLRRAHAAYYLDLAEQAEPHLTRSEQGVWLERLEREHDNLRAALGWARDSGDVALGLRLAGALWRFWYTHGYLSEGRSCLEEMLALAEGRDDAALGSMRAKALYGAATLASTQDDFARALALWQMSLAQSREVGDNVVAASALNALGLTTLQQGAPEQAIAFFEESLALGRAVGEPWGIARTLLSLGQIAYVQADYPRARSLFEECLALMRQVGSMSHSAVALLYLGHVAREQNDLSRALALYQEALALSQALGDKLRLAREMEGLATVAGAQDHAERAVRLLAAAAAMRDLLGSAQHPMDRPAVDRVLEHLRATLGESAFAAAWAAGQALSLEDAIYEALGEES